MSITTTQRLLTGSWTGDVRALENALCQSDADTAMQNDCGVTFFEIPSDPQLHVNVTHRYATRTAPGWSGPAHLPQGFVHNRRFGDTQPGQIIRDVRKMVFASRLR